MGGPPYERLLRLDEPEEKTRPSSSTLLSTRKKEAVMAKDNALPTHTKLSKLLKEAIHD
jgi:hypothetical protein